MQRTAPAPRPRSIKPDVLPAAEAIVIKLLEKDRRKRFQDAHHLHEELKALQRSLPSTPWEVRGAGENAAPPPPPPPPQSPGVIEWASRAALFSRMVSRAYPQGNAPPDVQSATAQAWDLAVARDAARGRGGQPHAQARGARAARAGAARGDRPQGRGAGARGVARASRAVGRAGGGRRACAELSQQAEKRRGAGQGRRPTRRAGAARRRRAPVFERAGAAPALVDAQARAARASTSRRPPRRTRRPATCAARIEELRAQLARYAEALEEDLVAAAARRWPRGRARGSRSRRRSARSRRCC